MSLSNGIILYLIGAYVLYWVIRSAISGGMKDFERWKRQQGTEPSQQD